MNIPVILGTGREGRQSEKVANYMLQKAKDFGFDSELIDVRDYPLSVTTRGAHEPFGEKMAAADGYIIVSPEYNHGPPGELKLLLDSYYKEYKGKPVGLVGVSIGGLGGSRGIEVLRIIASGLTMVPIPTALYFGNVSDLFSEQGEIQNESYGERAQKFLEEMSWYTAALKVAREKG